MGGSKQTQTTKSNPWEPAQAGLKDVLSKAQNYGNDMSIWTPQYSGDTNAGIAQLAQLGQQGSYGAGQIKNITGQTAGGFGTGMGTLQSTANGSMLGSNPYLDAVLNKSMGDAADKINAQFSAAGRYGSGAQTAALARELGGIDTAARMQNYTQERGNQLNAAQLLGNLGLQGAGLSAQVDPLQAQQAGYQLQAGQLKDAQNDATRMAPVTATNWQAGLTTPIAGLGGDSTTTTKQGSNTLGQIMGGLQMAAGLAMGNPMMAMGGMGSLTGGGGQSSLGVMGPYFGGFTGR